MQKVMKYSVVGLLLILIAGYLFVQYQTKNKTMAPAVTFQLITGPKLALSELRGRPVLVVFWATTCLSCLKEIPHYIDLYNKYRDKGLEIIAVAMPYDRPDHVLDMQKQKKMNYPIALDIQSEVVRAFGHIRITPNSFVIDPTGRIVKQQIGLWDIEELNGLIEALIQKQIKST